MAELHEYAYSPREALASPEQLESIRNLGHQILDLAAAGASMPNEAWQVHNATLHKAGMWVAPQHFMQLLIASERQDRIIIKRAKLYADAEDDEPYDVHAEIFGIGMHRGSFLQDRYAIGSTGVERPYAADPTSREIFELSSASEALSAEKANNLQQFLGGVLMTQPELPLKQKKSWFRFRP